MDYQVAMKDPIMWAMCIPAVLVAVIQAILISKKILDVGPIVELSRKDSIKAFRTGAVASIGPAMSSVVVMISLMAFLGPAFTWLRLCFIGSAAAESAAASMGAAAMGVELGGVGYDITAFANSIWACTLNAFGWLFMAGVFTPKLGNIREKISGTDPNIMGIISTSAMVGVFMALTVGYVDGGINAIGGSFLKDGGIGLIALVMGVGLMGLVTVASKKHPKLKEHTLSITLIIGLAVVCALMVIANA